MKKQIISMMMLSLLLIGNALPVNVSHSKKSNTVSIQQTQKIKKNKTKKRATIVEETKAITNSDEMIPTTNSDLNESNNENKTSQVEEVTNVEKKDNSIKISEPTPVKNNSAQIKQQVHKEQNTQNQIQNRTNETSSSNEPVQNQQTNSNEKTIENKQQENISNTPTQKYYFAKCDCGYTTESHESVQDAINKLFSQGHGNSSEHAGYVAGGDLD